MSKTTKNPLAEKMAPAKVKKAAKPAPAPKKKAKQLFASKKKVKAVAKEHVHVVTPMTDRNGTAFDPAIHAVHADGVTPHADSAGNFIAKTSHYDGAKKAFYGDSYRHA
jgi:hypothetical protein